MPRKLQDTRLDTRTARLKLAAQDAPYFRSMREGWAIGYRRLAGKSGTWLVRLYAGSGGYIRQHLGVADDLTEADGASTLTFAQAQERALAWLKVRQQQIDAERAGGPALAELTLMSVVEAYLAGRERRSRTGGQDARWRLTKHVLSDKKLALVRLPRLNRTDLTAWRARLPPMAPATVKRL